MTTRPLNKCLAFFATLIIPLLCFLALPAPALADDVPFSPAQAIASAPGDHRSLHAADMDGDGDLDVLGSTEDADTIAWWENTLGDGSAWTEHVVSSAFDLARGVRAADVDGDGDLDVLGAGSSTIAWWENTLGDGSAWTECVLSSTFDAAMSATGADVDGDGDLDVLGSAEWSDAIAWWENTLGDGSAWTEHTVISAFDGACAAHAADLDGDGDLDVVATACNGDTIAWLENTAGDGSAWTVHVLSSTFAYADGVYAADLDGDGDLDLLGAADESATIVWWENTAGDGSAWVQHTIVYSFYGARLVYAADIDADGDLDVLGAATWDDTIAWFENAAGDGSNWTRHDLTTTFHYPYDGHAADVDGDGDLDLLGAGWSGGTIAWWRNETIHRSAAYPPQGRHAVSSTFNTAGDVCAADLDGDGDLDVLGAANSDDTVAWWENTAGDGSAWTEHVVSNTFDGASDVYTADVDGDGDLDVLGAASVAGVLAWWENTAGNGSAWTEHTVSSTFDAIAVHAADVDGDGDLDVLGAAYYDDVVAWWENTLGDGSAWTEHVVSSAFDGACSVYAADVDGDGDLDVLGAAFLDDIVAWWENTAGDGSAWIEHTVGWAFTAANSVYAADVDGDGDLDVLGAAYVVGGAIAWWENTVGDGSAWTEHALSSTFEGAWAVHAADLDGDGDLDVLGAVNFDGVVAWWENTAGDGSAWTEHVVSSAFDGACAFHAADLDSDGDLDALGAADTAGDNIAWWENRGGQVAFDTAAAAPAEIAAGGADDVLRVAARHLGRAADGSAEWATLELLFESGPGVALAPSAAEALIDGLAVYRDDGSGAYEPGADMPVAGPVAPALDASGHQTLTFADGDPLLEITHTMPVTYFVVLTRTAANEAALPHRLFVSHATDPAHETTSTAQDRAHDLPLSLEYRPDTAAVFSVYRADEPIQPGEGGSLVYTDPQGLTTTLVVPAEAITQCVHLVFTPLYTPTEELNAGDEYAWHAFFIHTYPCGLWKVYLPLVLKARTAAGAGEASRPGLDPAAAGSLTLDPPLSLLAPGDPAFAAPVTLIIRYSDADVAGLDEATLLVKYWTGTAWADMAGTCTEPQAYVRDPANNIIRVPFCHMSQGVLVGD